MNFPRDLFIEQATLQKHSKIFIRDTLNYIDNLTKQKLPVIFSLKHLSILLDTDFHYLKNLLANRNYYYSYYLIRKKRGGHRRIIAPHNNIKSLQLWIKQNILDTIHPNNFAFGFIKNKSIFHNAKIHENKKIILNIDLENFFESISEKRIYNFFNSLGYCKNLSMDFAKICTATIPPDRYSKLALKEQEEFSFYNKLKEPVLIQGAPTSPSLSNLVCNRLDYRLSRLANKIGVNYSRYADDLTFSGSKISKSILAVITKIIESEDFKINTSKGGLYKQGRKQIVTGLLVNGHVRISQKFKKEIYRHLFFCKKYGPSSHFNKVSPNKFYRKEWLLGKISYVNSIEPTESKKMFEIFNQIEWDI